MIFFLWSLVLSAVHYARKQRLTAILSQYFFSPYYHDTMLLCRRIPTVSSSARNILRVENALTNGGTGTSLWKMSSEPTLPFQSESSLLYRTEEVEIVAKPSWGEFHVKDWQIVARPLVTRTPRIAFIVSLGLASSKGGHSEQAGIELAGVLANENAFSSESHATYTQIQPVHVNRLCKKIASRRGRPWEIIYDCDLDEFYNITFAWSENALFDIDGKASVKSIQTVHLPEQFFTSALSDNCQGSLPLLGLGSSLSSLSVSQQPLTLLELLHLNDSEEALENSSTSNARLTGNFDRLSSKYRSDTALHLNRPPQSLYRLPRIPLLEGISKRGARAGEQSLNGSIRYRACSPSATAPLSVSISQEQVPAFIRYLQEQERNPTTNVCSRSVSTSTNISPSTTFADTEEFDERSFAEIKFEDEEESDGRVKVNRVSTSVKRSVSVVKETNPRQMSRFTTIAVKEEDLSDAGLANDTAKRRPMISAEESDTHDDNRLVDGDVRAKRAVSLPRRAAQITTVEERTTVVRFMPDDSLVRHSPPPVRNVKLEEDKMAAIATNPEPIKDRSLATLEIFHRRRHSSMLPRMNTDFTFDDSLKSIRRRSLSPMAFQQSTDPLHRVSTFSAESFRRQSVTPTRRRFHSIAPTDKAQAKPPTILVYTGDNDELFNQIASSLSTMVSTDTYAIFHLSHEALCEHPWINRETACLLIADTKTLDDKSWTRLQDYFNNSGKMLFVCQNSLLASLSSCGSSRKSAKMLKVAFGERQSNTLGKDFENFLKKTLKMISKHKKVNETFHAKDLVGGYKYSVVINKNEDTPLLLYMENAAQQASALFSDATSEQLLAGGARVISDALARLSIPTVENIEIPHASRGYLICENDRLPWNMQGMHFNESFCGCPKVLIRQVKKHGELPEPSEQLFPVEVRTREEGLPDFDHRTYFRVLDTKSVGKALIYVPVCGSTQDIARSLAVGMPDEPIVVVARQQTKGKGRSGNQWLSPPGCAMFSFNFAIPPGTLLSDNVGFIQHILCVAMVDGVCSLHGLKDFPLRIKWPNDIYYGRAFKMGGLLVNASTNGDCIVCTLGAALNVANSKPTVSINDMLPIDSGIELTVEEFIANALNKFEYYVNVFQTGGRPAFLKYYYGFWLHSREEVTLAKSNEKVVVRGLDEHGFLEVRSRQSGRVMAVHPDGNTFDMMKGLISVKF